MLTKWAGQTITYDEIGNPLTYRDDMTMTWQNGRELASFENDDVKITYTYDPDGLRTQKNNEGLVTTDYVYEGGLLKQMKYGSYIFTFSYDANGSPIGFELKEDGTTTSSYYYYGLNSRGDVEALYNSSGTQIASYSYDAYGKPLSVAALADGHTTAIEVQPLRYRSYVYDFETGLYYLQSRYYDPVTCRFVNADEYASTGQGINGYNMFAYCLNNPVNMEDLCGHCGRFLGFLWKIDCKSSTCSTSKNYVKPSPPVSSIGTYSDKKGNKVGNIYVIQPSQLDDMNKAKEKNDIVIIDNRTEPKPSMQVQNSYTISDINQQTQICQAMRNYNTANPVTPAWYRTVDSMLIEWKAHNDGYNIHWVIGIFKKNAKERLRHVDFDNEAEGLGYWDFLEK